MSRNPYHDTDQYRLPDGMQRVAYDSDTERYTYQDTDGSLWEGQPGSQYGQLRCVQSAPARKPTVTKTSRLQPGLSLSTNTSGAPPPKHGERSPPSCSLSGLPSSPPSATCNKAMDLTSPTSSKNLSQATTKAGSQAGGSIGSPMALSRQGSYISNDEAHFSRPRSSSNWSAKRKSGLAKLGRRMSTTARNLIRRSTTSSTNSKETHPSTSQAPTRRNSEGMTSDVEHWLKENRAKRV